MSGWGNLTGNKTALVTGASGFIGRNCVAGFVRAGWDVLCVDRVAPSESSNHAFLADDLSDAARFAKILSHHRPQVMIHAAGPASVEASFRAPAEDFTNQTGPLLTVLEALRMSEVGTHVVMCSSAAVYGNPEQLPVTEDARQQPISPYGFHKAAKEALIREYSAIFGVRASIGRIFSVFGPGQKQLAVYDIARRMLAGDFSIFGTGEETRDYLYIDDLADALCTLACEGDGTGQAVNIASGSETSIRALAMAIAELLGETLPESGLSAEDREALGKPGRWRADVAKLSAMGFRPQVGFDEGLRRTVEWIRRQ